LKITKELSQKVLDVVDKGLCFGLGDPIPGQMCVEAAVCFAMGEKHGDHPDCVDSDLADFKISLNDKDDWETDKKRANGLRELAIAQLGTSSNFDYREFSDRLKHKLLFEKFCENLLKNHHLHKYLVEELKKAKWNEIDSILDEWNNYLENQYGIIDDYFSLYIETLFDINQLKKIAKASVEVLVDMKTPGSKYLYLTDTKKAKGKKKK